MKRRYFGALLIVALLVVVGACQKSRYCLCVSDQTPAPDTMVVNIDRSMKCKRLQRLGVATDHEGERVKTVYDYTCTQIDKDSVSTYPNLPTPK